MSAAQRPLGQAAADERRWGEPALLSRRIFDRVLEPGHAEGAASYENFTTLLKIKRQHEARGSTSPCESNLRLYALLRQRRTWDAFDSTHINLPASA